METINEKELEVADRLRPQRVTISTSIDYDTWVIAKRVGIRWTDALVFGIRFLIADNYEADYPDCRLLRKLEKTVIERNNALSKNKDEENGESDKKL